MRNHSSNLNPPYCELWAGIKKLPPLAQPTPQFHLQRLLAEREKIIGGGVSQGIKGFLRDRTICKSSPAAPLIRGGGLAGKEPARCSPQTQCRTRMNHTKFAPGSSRLPITQGPVASAESKHCTHSLLSFSRIKDIQVTGQGLRLLGPSSPNPKMTKEKIIINRSSNLPCRTFALFDTPVTSRWRFCSVSFVVHRLETPAESNGCLSLVFTHCLRLPG